MTEEDKLELATWTPAPMHMESDGFGFWGGLAFTVFILGLACVGPMLIGMLFEQFLKLL